jgi:hypothetical protein
MKRKNIVFFSLIAVSSMISAFLPYSTFNSASNQPLSDEEEQSLIYMREEEKLACDVYLEMLEKYNTRVFDNISDAEYRHMSFVKDLLDKFSVEDPLKSNERGEFANNDFSAAYKKLVEQGDVSLIDALRAGAEIEEMDISDLNKELAKVNNKDIINTYGYLKRGSENHLRAFMRNLDRRGGNYEPKYLTKSEFEDILNSE